MAITALFTPKILNPDQYNEAILRLEQAGAGSPKGRLYHVCYGNSDQLQIFGVWESVEDLQQFGKTLGPIAQQLGIDPGEPVVNPVQEIRQ